MSYVQLPESPIIGRNLVGGEWVTPAGATMIDVKSPYTGAVIGRVPSSSAADVAPVVEAAKKAAEGWRNTALRDRTAKMTRFRQLLEQNLDKLANSAAREAGKTVAEARAGVLKGIEVCDYALSIQNLDTGGALEVSRGVTCEFKREPLGVVAGITPFNFPAMVPLWMIPNALTVGNAFILKPSEKVPLTSLMLGELLMEAGVPPGVFSIVHGGKAAVDGILAHPDIQAVAFVGSTGIAKYVYTEGSAHGKRVLALGGAKNHLIVVPDADPVFTPQAVVDSFTGCAGQRCMAASVMVAVGDVQPIIDEMVRRASSIEVGPGMGALIDKASQERLEAAIGRAEAEGARMLVDGRGKKPSGAAYANGNWLGPTILDNVRPGSEAAHQGAVRADHLHRPGADADGGDGAAARLALRQRGLGLHHQRRGGAARGGRRAKAGMVGVNVGVPVPREPFSFGGINDSRFGHGDITGQGGVDFWSYLKKVTRKWTARTDGSWMS